MDILPNDGNLGQLDRFDDSTGWIPPSVSGGGFISIGSHLGDGGGILIDQLGGGGGPDPAQAPPAWVVGSYSGTRLNGEQISFSIDGGGHCFGLNNGNPFDGYYSAGVLTINGTSSQLVQTADGLDTIRTDTGERNHYVRSTSMVPAGAGTGTTAGGGAASGSNGTGSTVAGSGTGTAAAAVPATVLGMSPTTLLLIGAGVVAILILTGGKDK